MELKAKSFDYSIVCQTLNAGCIYPYFRSADSDKIITSISPHHGRSFVIQQNKAGKYIVSKGNGLSYTQYPILNTREFGDNSWGVLLRKDAIRDFNIGQEISSLGIKTNTMEYVIELKTVIHLPNGHKIKPVLLQYAVECPYRICDIAFMSSQQIKYEIDKWKSFKAKNKEPYLIAAEVLIKNLQKLHSNNILHNAREGGNKFV